MSSQLEEMASFITQWDLCTCMERHNNKSCTILFAIGGPEQVECFNLKVYSSPRMSTLLLGGTQLWGYALQENVENFMP